MSTLFSKTALFILIGFTCCGNVTTTKNENQTVDTLSITKVEILSFEKEQDTKSKFYEKYKKNCSKWNLSKTQIVDIILSSKRITGNVFHYDFDVLPCIYKGTILINEKLEAKFEINSGSSTILILKDTTYYLGYYGNKEYFLLKPGMD